MKKLSIVLLVALMALLVVSCGKKAETPAATTTTTTTTTTTATTAAAPAPAGVTYVRADEEEIYNIVLPEYEALLSAARLAENNDARFVLYAQAEAYLLDSAVMLPTTTQGGAYTISRVAYRTVPYANWGNDDDRLYGLIISSDFITPAERAEMIEIWNKAVKGEATYDPAAYLQSKGHSIVKDYKLTFSTAPVTLDTLNTSSQSDTEILVNTTDNLVQYNNLGQMVPSMAESWSVSDDGLTYTFNIRKGAYWYTSEGRVYAEVTAEDFEAGFQHMLDAGAGLEWLVSSPDGAQVLGAAEYLEGGSWADVGYKAIDKYTLQVTLAEPADYFLTMLTYSCFSPICKSFFLSRGGVFGIDEYADAVKDTKTYTYGKSDDVSSQVYNGAFLLQKLVDTSEIVCVKNPRYWNKDAVKIDSITWIYDAGENPQQTYKDVVNGVYAGMGLTEAAGTLALAKADGNFEKYAYVSDTTSTSYFCGLNVDRGTFALQAGTVASLKNEQQKIDTQTAMLNKNFRKAIVHAFDKATYNAVSRGEDLKLANLRNMYTHPEFVQLSTAQTDQDGHTFPAGTMYGEMVQYYVSKLDSSITVADGVNGWFDAAAAKSYIEKAKAELGNSVSWPIHIENVYYSASATQVAQAQAVKQVIEAALGSENVVVDNIEATTSADFYACGYRASNGEAGNFDIFYGSGWGPDFGDPCTYLNTFKSAGAGYMTKVIGLF